MLDGRYRLTGNSVPMQIDISHGAVPARIENEITGGVVLKKNLYYLNGSELLDGSRLLNASITEEVL